MKEFYFKRVLLAAAWAFCTLCAHAEEVEATFLVVELSSGQTESVMLTNDPSLPAPMLRHKEGIIVLNGMPYSTNEVKGMRLEKRMVDAIRAIDNETSPSVKGTVNVYDLSGRRVATLSISDADATQPLNLSTSQLPKGVYMINGKKIVVR
ncbi:MAG: T9SS type A sorting domain-containing protein [Prevotella sp.]|nr:T9SS type A sorting domain-containing protein [Prevotella sp.]MBR0525575.1 T9SS type A sorting domain-containing protein [Prevotella sp.]